ncbi:GP2b protein [Mikumi yellow baboon virus 1]|uniref:GP2b protein n=1 Tax=Mikumi yellow baboon virus 1 TaxID=1546177 RepID=A0A089G1B8_9NIDO|nr:GP2b protein [Mikumi yellow baboon virus 1]AIP91225.1 GP2b protein [Mikumi yellow baboon virus 1]
MLVFSIMLCKQLYMSLLCLQWTSSFILCLYFLPFSLAKESGSSSAHSSLAPLWLSLENMTSLRECLQTKQGFYEFSPIDDVINQVIPHTNYTLNGVPLQLSAACTKHHYPVAERVIHEFFTHQPTCSSIHLLPAQSVFFLEPEGRKALTLTQVAFCLILLTSCRSLHLALTKRSS